VALANDVYTPSDQELGRARRILAAMEQAKREGRGAVALDGRLIDIASIRQAETLVKKADQIAAAAR
jgi:malyl-CoA/(S)-citramalyl-CoA lyase